MYSHNDWFKTNVKYHVTGEKKFAVHLKPYQFNPLSFHSAAKMTAELLYGQHKNIYLAYSGGLDSEFILKTFIENGIPITPVIVLTPHNHIESCYAFRFCRRYSLTPVVLEYTEKQLLEAIYYNILLKVNHFAPTCACFIHMILVMKYAEKNNGVMLCGEHPVSDQGKNEFHSTLGNDMSFESGPFYYHALSETAHPSAFYYHTLEIFYAILKELDYSVHVNDAKTKLFGLEYRPKIEQQNDAIYRDAIIKLGKESGKATELESKIELCDTFSFCRLMESKYINIAKF